MCNFVKRELAEKVTILKFLKIQGVLNVFLIYYSIWSLLNYAQCTLTWFYRINFIVIVATRQLLYIFLSFKYGPVCLCCYRTTDPMSVQWHWVAFRGAVTIIRAFICVHISLSTMSVFFWNLIFKKNFCLDLVSEYYLGNTFGLLPFKYIYF